MKTLLLGIGVLIGIVVGTIWLAASAQAATPPATTAQGGTGVSNVSQGSILFGSVYNIRMATSSNFQWNNSLNKLSFTFGSSTAFSATNINAATLALTNALAVSSGGTGAATLTGCLTGNGTGAITGSGTCNTSNASVSSVATNNGLTGGPITTTGTIGLATINAGVLGAQLNGAVPTSQATSTLYGAAGIPSSALANTTVTPGSYTLTSLTVNAQGQITAASNGSAGTSASSTLLGDTNTWSGANKFNGILTTASTTFNNTVNLSNIVNNGLFTSSVGAITGTSTWATNFGGTGQNTNTWTGLALTTAGVWSQYAGSNPCTNQVALSISASGVISCTSVTNAMLSNSSINATYTGMVSGSASAALGGTLAFTSPSWPWNTSLNFGTTTSATTTVPWFQMGIQASSTSQLFNFTDWGTGSSSILTALGLATTSPFTRFSLGSGSILVAQASPATTTNMLVDCTAGSNTVYIPINASAVTLTLSSMAGGQSCGVAVVNGQSAAGTITWAPATGQKLYWTGGTAPTQTTTANKGDFWSFKAVNMSATATSTPGVKIWGAQTANF